MDKNGSGRHNNRRKHNDFLKSSVITKLETVITVFPAIFALPSRHLHGIKKQCKGRTADAHSMDRKRNSSMYSYVSTLDEA